MTISSEITRIKNNIASAYTSAELKGATLPDVQNSANLSSCIDSITGGSGVGEVIYAINNTGGELKSGDKAWLNKHYLDKNEAYQLVTFNNGTNIPLVHFDDSNNVLFKAASYKYKYVYDNSNETWVQNTLSGGKSVAFMRIIDGKLYTYVSKALSSASTTSSYIVDDSNEFAISGWALGNGYMISYSAGGTYLLKRVDETTGTVGDTVHTFTLGSGYLYSAFLKDNTLLLVSGNDNYGFYDISTGATLNTGTFEGISTATPMMFATGTSIGDYLIFQQGTTQNVLEGAKLVIYKIGEGYTFSEADDLQADLASCVGEVCRIQYYNDTGILTVGTLNKVLMFKYTNGVWKNLNLTLSMPTDWDKLGSYAWAFWISNDMTSAVLMSNYSSSKEYMSLYKLSTSSKDWFADPYNKSSSLTLTGVATGNTDDEGRVEVEVSAYCEESEDTGGGGSAAKYGVSIDVFLGDINDKGVLLTPTSGGNLVFTGIKDIDNYALYNKFSYCNGIESVNFPDLTSITRQESCTNAFVGCKNLKSASFSNVEQIGGSNAFYGVFSNCSKLESFDFSKLKKISGNYAMCSAFKNTAILSASFPELVSVYDSCLNNAFTDCKSLTSISFPKLPKASGYNVLGYMCQGCSSLTSVDFSNLTTVDGSNVMSNMFQGCSSLTSVDFSSLVTATGSSCLYYLFYGCSSLISVDFSNLTTVTGSSSLGSAFMNCTSLPKISFPSLTTFDSNSFSSMTFYNCSALTEIHFRADVQSQIEATNGYSTKWGATNATIYFDL